MRLWAGPPPPPTPPGRVRHGLRAAPYFIENRTDAVVRLQQKPLGPTYQLAPRQTIPFAWDDPDQAELTGMGPAWADGPGHFKAPGVTGQIQPEPYGAKALLLRIYETTEEFPLTFIKACVVIVPRREGGTAAPENTGGMPSSTTAVIDMNELQHLFHDRGCR